jgi:hypothetical protein
VLASSSLPQDELLPHLDGLAALEVTAASREPVDALPQAAGRTLYLVHKEGAAQSSLRLGHPSLRFDALGDYYLAGLMNFNLGGTFDSRINLNLREDKGYTYGISSGFSGGPELGSFRVSSEVNKEATAASVSEVLRELEAYAASGMTDAEYAYLQNAVGQSDALRYETPGAKLGLLSAILRYDLPLDYRRQQQALLEEPAREVSAKELSAHFDQSYGIFSGPAEHRAELRFSPEMSRWVAEEVWHPDQQGRFDTEGRWLLQLPFGSARELIMDILRYGAEVEVLAPAFLREAVAAEARKTADLYPM